MDVTIGIPAHNEEENIGKLLVALINEKFPFKVKELIIVASGCTDGTVEKIKKLQKKNEKIKLIIENNRMGKASAINCIRNNATGDIIVFIDADNIEKKGSINRLLEAFSQSNVGAVTGNPTPLVTTGVSNSLFRTIWYMHHELSLKHPKICGQIYAIKRHLLKEIPYDSIVDDAYIHWLVVDQGYDVKYAPRAVTYMKPLKNILELMKWRRRISRGYIQLYNRVKMTGFPMDQKINIFLKFLLKNPTKVHKLILVFMIELLANVLAFFDSLTGYTPYCWKKCKTN